MTATPKVIPEDLDASAGEHLCDTCLGVGSHDERLGGYSFSNPEAECPDCDGKGWMQLRNMQGARDEH